ncbi:MAG: uroporphyrinogen decarboxylase [Calditrichaeota bacterium]|nr:uroporphyrinogen decarboxylase [Calditrichota bacterium]
MNSYERYMRGVAGKSVDYLPRVPILMQYAAEYIGSHYGAFASDYRVLVEANATCAGDFDFDQLSAISDPYRETQGFGADIEFIPDGVPRCLTPPLQNSMDLLQLKRPNPLKSERMLDRIKAIREFKKNFDRKYSIMGWIEGPAAEAADLRTVGHFLMDLVLEESFIQELMDICVDVAIDFALAQIEAGADSIGIGDAIASQVSPQVYDRLIQPREKIIVREIQKSGALVRLHICGDITHLLPGIADLNVDILDVDYMVDMVQVRKAMGGKTVLAGNLDPVQGVKFGTPKSIQSAILKTYEQVGNPYIVNAGCEIPSGTPIENLQAFCKPVPFQK